MVTRRASEDFHYCLAYASGYQNTQLQKLIPLTSIPTGFYSGGLDLHRKCSVVSRKTVSVTETTWSATLPLLGDQERSSQWPALNAHCPPWISAVATGLRHKTILLKSHVQQTVTGVLPLCLVSGPLFGKFLVSLPYVNTGGVWATDADSATALVDAACDLADRLDVKHLELRHEVPIEHPKLNMQRIDKVHMRLALPNTIDDLSASLKSKLRSQVKKSHSYSLSCEYGGVERINDFYDVFAVNMRDLGTPVFSKSLFTQTIDAFDGNAEFAIIKSDGKAVAAGLMVHHQGTTEIPSASCLRAFNRMNANMFLYWQMFSRAIERRSDTFDFGRSSIDSGTHRFKKQWGTEACPAVWQYYVRKGNPEDMRPDAGGKQRLVQIWQRLPVWLTRLIGPAIVRGIP